MWNWFRVQISYSERDVIGYIHSTAETVGELLETFPDLFKDNVVYLLPTKNEKVEEEAIVFSPALFIRITKE